MGIEKSLKFIKKTIKISPCNDENNHMEAEFYGAREVEFFTFNYCNLSKYYCVLSNYYFLLTNYCGVRFIDYSVLSNYNYVSANYHFILSKYV